MKFTLEVQLGNSKLTIEQECDGIKGLFADAGIFSTFPTECNNCQSGNLALNERKTKKGEYYEITCGDCGHRKQYGQYKEGDGLYPKDWEAPYEADGESSSDSGSSAKKSGGKSALQKAKEAKLAKAQKEEQDYEEPTDEDDAAAEEQEEKKAAPKAKAKSRSSILDKYKKKSA